ncbi:TonB-dependent receptor plug domain-containing protein [Afipia carboxidovorans]|uniref:TonB-dependent receptor plug domain-containing protein n=1 Tax=Afipia carboxidovorans TaxID=40137 RepID=UPI0030862103|nr:TonB-dependent receptor [Afipia carboxidovorans]
MTSHQPFARHQIFTRKLISPAFAATLLAGTALALPAYAQQGDAPLPEIEVVPAKPSANSRPQAHDKRVDARPKPRPDTAPANLPRDVVTSPTTVPTPVSQIANSVSVVTAADIATHGWRSVSEVLQNVPGLNVVQAGGPGGQTSIFTRGTNSNHTKIMIDGIDVGDPSTPSGAYDIAHLTTADIDRIEVLRGPQSGLYGSDAIGGVISITTKKGEGPPKASALIEGGSHGTVNAAAGIRGSQDKFSYALNVSNYQTMSIPVTPRELLAPGQSRINDSYNNKTVSTRLGYDVTEDFGINFTGRYTDSQLRFTPDQFPAAYPDGIPGDYQSTQNAHQFISRTEATWSLFDGRFKNYFGFNYSDLSRFNADPYSFSGFSTIYSPVTSTNEGERFKYDWRGVIALLPGQTVVLGAESQTDRFRSRSASGLIAGAENGNRGVYAELQSNFNDRFFVVSNIRLDNNDTFGDHVTYRIAPAFIVPGLETKLKASYGTGFKAPSLFQLYDTVYGNLSLKPEESTGYDVGFEQPIAGGKIRFGTTYFNNRLTNLIENLSVFPYSYFNVAKAHTDGFESFVSLAVDTRFSLRLDHTYTHAIDALTGLDLKRRPRHKVGVTTNWKPTDDLSLSASVIWNSSFQDLGRYASYPYDPVTAPGYTIVNIAANYTLAPGVTAFARIDNLFDEKYQDPLGYLRPGLGVFGGFRLNDIVLK